MLVIRLARTGKKKQAYFRIVVAEKHRAVKAKFVEVIGNYNPHSKQLVIDKEKLEKYLKNGAQPSNSLSKLLKKNKFDLPKWVKITEKNRPPKEKKSQDSEESPANAEKPTDEDNSNDQKKEEGGENKPSEEKADSSKSPESSNDNQSSDNKEEPSDDKDDKKDEDDKSSQKDEDNSSNN